MIEASPLLGLAPARSSASPCSSKTSLKNVRTAWPKMIGSETFIIVAFRCTENRTPCSRASSICSARNASSALRRMTAASTISPACTSRPSLSVVLVPSAASCSIVSVSASESVTERSECRKSPSSIVETCVLESLDHSPIECGCLRAKLLTDSGARRSELPSRSTGLTALPFTWS